MKNYFEKLRKSQDKKVIRLNKGDIKLSLKQQEEIIEMFDSPRAPNIGDEIFLAASKEGYRRWEHAFVHDVHLSGHKTLITVCTDKKNPNDKYQITQTLLLRDIDFIIK